MRVFVGDDRNGDALANGSQLVRAPGRNRLFAELDFEPSEVAQNGDGALDVPAFVRVDAKRAVIASSNRSDRLDLLGRRAASELDLQNRKVARFVEFLQRRLRVGDPDRERRRRARRRIETEQRVERFAEFLADEIVEREIETGSRRRRDPEWSNASRW